jgi:hypothetical protein
MLLDLFRSILMLCALSFFFTLFLTVCFMFLHHVSSLLSLCLVLMLRGAGDARLELEVTEEMVRSIKWTAALACTLIPLILASE